MKQEANQKSTAIVYTKFRWFVLASMLVAIIGQGAMLISPTPLVGEIAKTFNIEPGLATTITMVPFNLCVAVFGLLGGFIFDKFGTAKSFLACSIVAAAGAFLLPALSTSIPGLIIARMIAGAASGPMIASGARVAAEYFPMKERAMYQGFVGAALSLGITMGYGIGPQIAGSQGWKAALSAPGFVAVLAALLAIIMIFGPKPPVHLSEKRSGDASDKAAFKEAFKIPSFWFCFFAAFCLSWVMNGFQDLTPGHIAIPAPMGLGLGPIVAGQMMLFFQIPFLIGSLLSGIIVQTLFKGVVRKMIPIVFILVAVFACLSIIPGIGMNSLLLTLCLILTGFFMGMPDPLNQAFIATTYPENITGRVGGFTMGLSIFGGTLGVMAGATLVSITHTYYASIVVVAVFCIIGAIAGSRLIPPKQFEGKVD